MVFDTSDWQGGTLVGSAVYPIILRYVLGVAGTQTLISAAAGQHIIIHQIMIQNADNSQTSISLQDTSGTPILLYDCRNAGFGLFPMGGLPLALGVGVRVNNIGGLAMVNADLVNMLVSFGS